MRIPSWLSRWPENVRRDDGGPFDAHPGCIVAAIWLSGAAVQPGRGGLMRRHFLLGAIG